jgi:acetyl esterase/lipase
MARQLDPQLSAILDAIVAGGMFDDYTDYAQMRERFEATAPMMWDPANLPVDSVEDRSIPGPAGALPIRIYRPEPDPAPQPVLVYFHGGGFTIGSIDTADSMSRFLAREARAVVVSVGFRLAPEHPFPAPVDDCFAAIRWVHANAPALGGDPTRVAVGGDASGATYATVCAQLAADTGGPPLVFQLLLSPCTDFASRHPSRLEFAEDPLIPSAAIDALMDAYAPDVEQRTDPRCSPLLAPDPSGQPPAYILAAEYDFLRDEERAYAERLDAAGVPVTFRCWPGTVHDFFSMYDHVDVARTAMAEAAAALRTALRPGPEAVDDHPEVAGESVG